MEVAILSFSDLILGAYVLKVITSNKFVLGRSNMSSTVQEIHEVHLFSCTEMRTRCDNAVLSTCCLSRNTKQSLIHSNNGRSLSIVYSLYFNNKE